MHFILTCESRTLSASILQIACCDRRFVSLVRMNNHGLVTYSAVSSQCLTSHHRPQSNPPGQPTSLKLILSRTLECSATPLTLAGGIQMAAARRLASTIPNCVSSPEFPLELTGWPPRVAPPPQTVRQPAARELQPRPNPLPPRPQRAL